MKFPGIPENEEERLKSLYMVDLLDSKADERFERLTRVGRKLFNVPVALISLLDRDRQWLLACEGLNTRETSRDVSFCGHAILQEGAFIVNDALKDERFYDNPLVTREPFIRFYAGYPVHLPDGAVVGTICLIDSKPRDFRDDDVATLKDLAYILEDEFQVINLAMTDSLTGIPNRRGFYRSGDKRFNELRQNNKSFSIIYFDLDKFKPINDLWGHAEGDEVLKNFSNQLMQQLSPQDIVGRLGGDEFAVLLTKESDTESFLMKLRESMDLCNQQSGKPYNINYSYGIMKSNYAEFDSLLYMVKQSDRVMYSEKRMKKLN